MSKPGHDIVSVNDILGGTNTYSVPLYQRGYAWDEVNFKELWEDLTEKTLKGEDLFLGSVIINLNNEAREIVDGQQRLITFTILFRAMYDELEGDDSQDRFRREIYRLICQDDGSTFKLTLGEEDEDFFYRFIKKIDRESNRRGVKKSHKRIRVAYELFRAKLSELALRPEFSGKVDMIDKLFEAIKHHSQILEIDVNNEYDAYSIFESINAKRVDLTPAELIKNYIFSAVSQNPSELFTAKENWATINEMLSPDGKDVALTSYFRHFWIAYYSHVREKELYREIKNEFLNHPSDIPAFLRQLADFSANYTAIIYPEGVETTTKGINLERVISLNRFGFKQAYPLLLATANVCEDQAAFDGLCQKLESVIMRRSIKGSNPNELEEVLVRCAQKVASEGRVNTASINAEIDRANLVPTDMALKLDIIEGSDISNPRIILEDYEASISSGEKILKNPTIEHIMPQIPISFEDWGFTREEHGHWIGNIGNLTLLGRPLNSKSSNANFDHKKTIYSETDYNMTKKVAESAEWKISDIKYRAELLYNFIITRW